MIEIEPIRLLSKLDFMTSYLDRLKAYESVTLEEYLADRDKQLIVERLLQLIIQVALDLNRYFLKHLQSEQSAKNFDSFVDIAKHGIITPELAGNLAESGSLRNRLVHVYDEIDPVLVYRSIQKALQYYPLYQRQVTAYIGFLEAESEL